MKKEARPWGALALIVSLLLGPVLLVLSLVAAPAGILWWMAHSLFGVALIGTVLFEAGEGANPLLAVRLPRVWAAAIGAESVLMVAMPEQVLSLFDVPEAVYPWAQTLAAGALVVWSPRSRRWCAPTCCPLPPRAPPPRRCSDAGSSPPGARGVPGHGDASGKQGSNPTGCSSAACATP